MVDRIAASTIAAMAGLLCSMPAIAQTSTFTGSVAGDNLNWCNGSNWFPSGVPADEFAINVPAGLFANMASCDGVRRTLGQVNARGIIRFYTPITFAGGGSLTNPIFECSDPPVIVGAPLTISGSQSYWQGGLFSGGDVINEGTLIVERSLINGRSAPHGLIDGCGLTNAGTMRVRFPFNINDVSSLLNSGSLIAEVNSTIGRQTGTGFLENTGEITVQPGVSLGVVSGLSSTGAIASAGTLTLQSETSMRGTAWVDSGGAIRFAAEIAEPVDIGPVQFGGDGNVQLSSGQFHLHDITTGVRYSNGAHGLWFTAIHPIDVTQARVNISDGGLLSWSQGLLAGTPGGSLTPNFIIQSGGIMSAVGASGFSGGGEAYGVNFRVEGSQLQYSRVGLFDHSRVTVMPGGSYHLSHTRLEGDDSALLDVSGTLAVNHPNDARTDAAFLSHVPLRVAGDGQLILYYNDLICGNTGSASHVEFGGAAFIQVLSGARFRSFGETIVTDGAPVITGSGLFVLESNSVLSVRDATLSMEMTSGGEFSQVGTIRADPENPAHAGIKNDGNWVWRAGGITFPQGSFTPVSNTETFVADCGLCQLRSDFRNEGFAYILDTLVLAEQGVEYTNNKFTILTGTIADATGAQEGKLNNSGTIEKVGSTPSQIATTLDNQGSIQVDSGTLVLSGPIVQYLGGPLVGGTWIVRSGATLSLQGRPVTSIGDGTYVHISGTWANFLPQENSGELILDGTNTLPFNFVNNGTLGGVGTANLPSLRNRGRISPGQSPGRFTVNGGFDQTDANGVLEIELAGLTPGTQHDVLAVTGTATLGGTLRVVLLDGYVPVIGNSFIVLTAASIAGNFASVEPPIAGLPIGTALSVERTATSVILHITCLADYNADTVVDFFDYLDFVQAFSQTSPAADVNRDGIVDFFDYLDFVQSFSTGC